MKTTIIVYRLPPTNNQPHQWSWGVTFASGAVGGIAKTKKEALKAVQETIDSLQSE